VDGPFTTFYGGEWPMDYVGERGEWAIHHVAAGFPRPVRNGHIALNYPNPGIGGDATPCGARRGMVRRERPGRWPVRAVCCRNISGNGHLPP
jgi:hypothetical protein